MKISLAVFFGCQSVEHEVSIISAVQAMASMNRERYDIHPVYVTKNGETVTGEALFSIENYKDIPALISRCTPVTLIRKNGKVVMTELKAGLFKKAKETVIDVAFPIVHGTNCEDGTLQGYFEFLNLPYVGCDIISSAVGMDKAVFKDVLGRFDLPVLDCVTFYAREYALDKDKIADEIIEKIGLLKILEKIPAFFSHAYLLIVVFFGWILFRFSDFRYIPVVIKGLFGLNGNAFMDFETKTLLIGNIIFIIVALLNYMDL